MVRGMDESAATLLPFNPERQPALELRDPTRLANGRNRHVSPVPTYSGDGPLFITQQPLGVDCRNWSLCPLGDFPGRYHQLDFTTVAEKAAHPLRTASEAMSWSITRI